MRMWIYALCLISCINAAEIGIVSKPSYLRSNEKLSGIASDHFSSLLDGVLGASDAVVPLFYEARSSLTRPRLALVLHDSAAQASATTHIPVTGPVPVLHGLVSQHRTSDECSAEVTRCLKLAAADVRPTVIELSAVKDVKALLEEVRRYFGDEFLALAVDWPAATEGNSRRKRAASETAQRVGAEPAPGLAKSFDNTYSAIFNIILWLSIVLAIIIYAVVYHFFTMDPAKDSVLYRMTNIRLKKD